MKKNSFGNPFGWFLIGLSVGGIGHSINTKEYVFICIYAFFIFTLLLVFFLSWYFDKISKRNLCDTCENHFASCNGFYTFGDGVGKDNVCLCIGYKKKQ